MANLYQCSGYRCPRCNSLETKKFGRHFLKSGRFRRVRFCKICKRQYTLVTKKYQKLWSRKKDEIVKLFLETVEKMQKDFIPISKREVKNRMLIGKMRAKLNDSTVNEWLKLYFPDLKRASSRPRWIDR